MSNDSSDIDKKTPEIDAPETAVSADRADEDGSSSAENEGKSSAKSEGTSSAENKGSSHVEETPIERNAHQIAVAAEHIEQINETEAKRASETGEVDPQTQKTAEEVAQLIADSLEQLMDDKDAPAAPTESYIHPVTGREVYVPKNKPSLGPSALIMTFSLLMFVGGALATLMMVARAFELHGTNLLTFVIGSCAVVLGMAGGLLFRTFGDNDKWWVGAGVGACFGAMSAVLIYLQTSHHAWWR